MGIKLRQIGDFSHLETYLERQKGLFKKSKLDSYGRIGVDALRESTPKDSGKTAESWEYRITHENGSIKIDWINTNVNNGVNIAVIIRYGHGTKNGGYVAGRDYITPAMQPVFDKIAADLWKEVKQ